MATKKKDEIIATMELYPNPLMAALRENDKKNLFKTNVTTAFLKTGFPLYDYYFGAVINVHDDKGVIIRQEPRVGQAAGTFNLIIGNTGTGKAQPVDTIIPVPNGYKRMGDLTVGDIIFGEAGQCIRVEGVFPQGKKKVYKVVFESGRSTKCCGEHLWKVYKGLNDSRGTVMSLDAIMNYKSMHTLRFPKLRNPLRYTTHSVQMDPYIVGMAYATAKLDTDNHIVLTDISIAEKIAKMLNAHVYALMKDEYVLYTDDDIHGVTEVPRDVMDFRASVGDKDGSDELLIPWHYMVNDKYVRQALMRGIFDACGSIDEDKHGDLVVRCRLTNHHVAESLVELAHGMGMDAYHYTRGNNFSYLMSGETIRRNYHIVDVYVPYVYMEGYFTDEYKRMMAMMLTQNERDPNTDRMDTIAKIIPLDEEEECVCIKVNTRNELYVTNDCIITHNTTLGAQISGNIIRPYKYSNAIHFDGENRFDVSRCETITGLPAYFFDGSLGGERYMIRSGMVGLDVIQEMIVKTYVTKMKLKDELMVPSGFKDEFGNDVMIFQPTVVLIDSMTTVLSETFNPDNSKEASDAEKMRGNTEGARDAKTLKGFFKDILPLCKEANIIVYGINHINSNMSMNAFIPPTRQQNYLAQDEIIPGGKTMIYYPFNIIKLTAKPSDDFTEEGDGFAGHLVMVEPIKSSSNQSGNKRKGVSFDLVFSHKQGFDSLRSTVMYWREYGIIEGNKTRMKFKDDPSFTFTLKGIYKEKDEKPIWECIKKFIIPHLMTHLSFVEPMERQFDERCMDY